MIITIIGFLVDSKQKRKKKELELENSTVSPTEESISVGDSDSLSVAGELTQTVSTTVDNVVGVESSDVYNLGVNNQSQEPNMDSYNQNLAYSSESNVSLSEQKPHFEPREVNIPNSSQTLNYNLNNQFSTPQPVNAVSINQPVQQQFYGQVTPSAVNYQNTAQAAVFNSQQVAQNTTVGNIQNVQPVYQNVAGNQMQFQGTSNVSQPVYTNNLTNSIENVQSTNASMVNQNLSNNINGGIGFVTSPQQQSNSDDIWKL